ncbi:MAG: hypothetical protein LBT30_04900 [Clostridiales bacterium]|nr:hypothetical protein [Clostridiales bacterium]
MKWYVYVICFVVIALGSFGGFDLYRIYTAKSDIVGTLQYETVERVDVINLDVVIAFELVAGTNTYKYVNTYTHVEFDGQEFDYRIVVNGNPCSQTQYEAGYIYGEYSLSYFDIEGNKTAQSVLGIKFVFLAGRTRLELSMDNVNGSISYFYGYMLDHGLNISVIYYDEVVE